MKLHSHWHAALLAFILFAGSSDGLAETGPEFAKEIAPVFTKYCTGCHNDQDREGKLSLSSYESLLKGGAKGGVVTPGQPDLSRLVRVLTGQTDPKMPPEGEEAPQPAEIELIKAWIAAGAKGPRGTAAFTTLVTPEVKLKAPPKLAIHAVALSPGGDFVAIARHGEVELQLLSGRKTLRKFTGLSGSVNGVTFSRDGKIMVAAAGEPGLFGEAALFRIENVHRSEQSSSLAPAAGVGDAPSLQTTFRGHQDSLYAAVLSPDGQILATGGYDSTIKLWNVANGKEIRTLEGHNGPVYELAFRPDGKILASASGDRTVKLWNIATGERLETLKESLKELYTLAFSPDGTRLAAGGVDNRIRVWRITPHAQEGTNVLLHSVFAHETPILRLVWSADGRTIASSGEDRLIKIWNAETMTIRQTLPPQSDWVSGLAISRDGRTVVAGRVDGTIGVLEPSGGVAEVERQLVPLPEVPPEVDYGPQPPLDQLPRVAEVEPNDRPEEANAMPAPGVARGNLGHLRSTTGFARGASGRHVDEDLFRFEAKAGDQWIIETRAAQAGSAVDTKIEVLDAAGQPVPRLLLRAVRNTEIEFRGMTSEQRGVRLANWEEMLLNEYVYLTGEVIKHYQQRRGPDADAQFYPENGNRFAYFDTTPRAHALGEPGYIVVPYAIGTELPNNGLPIFMLFYENDDDGQRKLGKDSRLTFVAPADGTYLVRVSDVRGFAGDDYSYELTIRRPQPDFNVTLAPAKLAISPGSGKPLTVKAERIDNFHGPIRVEIADLPPGYSVTTPIVIQEGLYEASGVVHALPDAAAPTQEQIKAIRITAAAVVCGRERTKEVGGLTSITLAEKPKVVVHLEPLSSGTFEGDSAPAKAAWTTAADLPGAGLVRADEDRAISIARGGTVTCRLWVERNGFNERIALDVANLPHGVIVDDIGLNGVLIPENQTERTIFLRAEGWVPEQRRTFFATAQVDGNQCSLPLVLHVRPRE